MASTQLSSQNATSNHPHGQSVLTTAGRNAPRQRDDLPQQLHTISQAPRAFTRNTASSPPTRLKGLLQQLHAVRLAVNCKQVLEDADLQMRLRGQAVRCVMLLTCCAPPGNRPKETPLSSRRVAAFLLLPLG